MTSRVKVKRRKRPSLFGPYPDLCIFSAVVGLILDHMEAHRLIMYGGGILVSFIVLSTALARKKRGE